MGTNYYVREKLSEKDKKEMKHLLDNDDIERVSEMIPNAVHIGKNSGGWRFCFNHNNWKHYKNIEELKEFIKNNTFYDEYGRHVDANEFWENVERKENDPDMLDGNRYADRWEEFHGKEPKPCYMMRSETGDEEHFGYRFSSSTEFS